LIFVYYKFGTGVFHFCSVQRMVINILFHQKFNDYEVIVLCGKQERRLQTVVSSVCITSTFHQIASDVEMTCEQQICFYIFIFSKAPRPLQLYNTVNYFLLKF